MPASQPKLRTRILVRVILVMVGSLAAITVVQAWLLTRAVGDVFEERLDRLVHLIEESSFPLTPNVLDQLSQLSGADLVALDAVGAELAQSPGATTIPRTSLEPFLESPAVEPATTRSARQPAVAGLRRIQVGAHAYFVAVARRTASPARLGRSPIEPDRVVIVMSTQPFDRLRRQALAAPLFVAIALLPIMIWTAIRLSRQVSQPILEIQQRLSTLAAGDLSVPEMHRADTIELAELQHALESTASALRERERTVRANEQMSALIQVGHGIAHNIKNAVTGCRLAIDLAERDAEPTNRENLTVVRQQLSSIDQYIQRFLNQAREHDASNPRVQSLDVAQVVTHAIQMLEPRIQHAGVEVQIDLPPNPFEVAIDRGDLEQLIMLLVQNGMDAATSLHARTGQRPQVQIQARLDAGHFVLRVRDNGPGPHPAIRDRMFEPFASNKREGTGLGLAEASRIVRRYNGTLHWSREEPWTTFEVRLDG